MAENPSHDVAGFLAEAVTESAYLFFEPAPGVVDLGVVCVGRERCDVDYRIVRDDFAYYCVEVVVAGRGRVSLGGTVSLLDSGSVFAYGPGVPHVIESEPNYPLEKYFFDFSGARALSILQSCDLWQQGVRRLTRTLGVEECFLQLQEASRIGGGRGTRMGALVMEILLLRIGEASRDAQVSPSTAELRYEACRRVIEEDFLSLQNLSEVAAACHLGRAYLCRLFKRYAEESPYHLLVRCKMEYAAGRMRHAGIRVRAAAAEVGFADPYHFSRTFKRILGVSPSRYLT
ncbi:MAG: helix-turn-helix domain-containing protein [Planctomycetota bacterium]|jgi:AraC-like DNA-binding protein